MAELFRPELRLGANYETAVDTFDGYDVSLDCFQMGSAVTFSLWRSVERRSNWEILRERVKVGMPFVFRINDATQINGHIDHMEEVCDRSGGAMIVISGRDMGARALDWDANPALALKGLTVEDAITRLYSDLGISVFVGVRAEDARSLQTGAIHGSRAMPGRRRRHTRKLIDRTHPRAGEKVHGVAESILRRAGLFQWVAPMEEFNSMGLVVDRFAYKDPPTFHFTRKQGLVAGTLQGNIQSGRHVLQTRTIPTFVRVFGHCGRGDKFSFRYAADVPTPGSNNDHLGTQRYTLGKVHQPHPRQPRYVKSQRARTFEESQQEAERIIAKAMQNFRTYTVTTQGHGQMVEGVMKLFTINTVAHLEDEVFGLNENMLIHRVQFQGRRNHGTHTVMTMIPLDTVQLTYGVVEGEAIS